jgi:hypothetical protein
MRSGPLQLEEAGGGLFGAGVVLLEDGQDIQACHVDQALEDGLPGRKVCT